MIPLMVISMMLYLVSFNSHRLYCTSLQTELKKMKERECKSFHQMLDHTVNI
jgi:hypothetical protein